VRVGVLASGAGSNLQAILDACRERRIAAEVAVVLCNVPGARALARAEKASVPAVLLEHVRFPSREAFDAAAVEVLREHRVELVCLAGFMRLLSKRFLQSFPSRVLNIHPGLLPACPGLHAQRQALEAGARFAGCTVHFVDEGVDTGPILMQAVVPVRPDDDEAALSARILEQEHVIYPRAIDLLARGRVRIEGRRAIVEEGHTPRGVLLSPA
jgi:phosphoribosylglycinamide formyltransferase-1